MANVFMFSCLPGAGPAGAAASSVVALHGSQACQGRALRSFRDRAPHLLAQQAIAGLLLLLALRPMVHEAHGSCMSGRYLRPVLNLGTDLMGLGLWARFADQKGS